MLCYASDNKAMEKQRQLSLVEALIGRYVDHFKAEPIIVSVTKLCNSPEFIKMI